MGYQATTSVEAIPPAHGLTAALSTTEGSIFGEWFARPVYRGLSTLSTLFPSLHQQADAAQIGHADSALRGGEQRLEVTTPAYQEEVPHSLSSHRTYPGYRWPTQPAPGPLPHLPQSPVKSHASVTEHSERHAKEDRAVTKSLFPGHNSVREATEESEPGSEADSESEAELEPEVESEIESERRPGSKAGPQSKAKPKLQLVSNAVKKGKKRKSQASPSITLSSAPKRQRLDNGIQLCQSVVAFLPYGMSADDLRRALTSRTETRYHEDLVDAVQMFFGPGRPASLERLTIICELAVSTGTADDISNMVAKLDEIESVDPLIRRRVLVRLLDRRKELEVQCTHENETQKSARRSRVTKYDLRRLTLANVVRDLHKPTEKLQKPDDKALMRLMAECYPRLPPPRKGEPRSTDAIYIELKNKLKGRLKAARNWRSLKERFGIGILFFVHCDIKANR